MDTLAGEAPGVELQLLALAAARAGAAAITDAVRGGALTLAFKRGSYQDPVTNADRASELAIRALIAQRRPADAIRTEESADTDGTSGLRWVIDPLDGTVNVSHGIRHCAVSVAVEICQAAQVPAAAIVRPGSGSWLALSDDTVRGTPSRLGVTSAPLQAALLSFAVPSDPDARRASYRLLSELAPEVQDLRNSGSTVCDLALVVTGKADGFISLNPAPWDIAAGLALVRACGGTVRQWRRADGLDVVVAGGAAVVDAVVSRVG